MIALLIGCLTIIGSFLLAFFLAIGQMQAVVEMDFMHRVKANAQVHGLEWGQLEIRARTLWDTTKSKEIRTGYTRSTQNVPNSNVSFTINISDDTENLRSDVKVTSN